MMMMVVLIESTTGTTAKSQRITQPRLFMHPFRPSLFFPGGALLLPRSGSLRESVLLDDVDMVLRLFGSTPVVSGIQ